MSLPLLTIGFLESWKVLGQSSLFIGNLASIFLVVVLMNVDRFLESKISTLGSFLR